MEFISLMEYIGTFMFAVSGAEIACEEKLDYLGIFILAWVTSLGGGVIRDAVFSISYPYAFKSWVPYFFIIAAVLIVIKTKGKIKNGILTTGIDAVGLSAFTVSASANALMAGQNIITVIFAGFVTAVGGGMIRDIIVNRKPVVLTKDIYASAALAGSIMFVVLFKIIPLGISEFIAFSTVFTVRMFCYMKHIELPKVSYIKSA